MNNYYFCPKCNKAWEDEWDCACDSECPVCEESYTPFDTKKEWLNAQKIQVTYIFSLFIKAGSEKKAKQKIKNMTKKEILKLIKLTSTSV